MSRTTHMPYTVEEELWRLYRRLHTYEAWTYDLSEEMRQRLGRLAGMGMEGLSEGLEDASALVARIVEALPAEIANQTLEELERDPMSGVAHGDIANEQRQRIN